MHEENIICELRLLEECKNQPRHVFSSYLCGFGMTNTPDQFWEASKILK